jgi:PB1 domain
MYGRASMAPSSVARPPPLRSNRQNYIEEEDDDDDYNASYDEGDFEMVSRGPGPRRSNTRRSVPEIRKIRVKVHADDTRYVMIGPAIEFRDFVDQIRTKFGIRQSFKIKIKDDSDMITMADQDDLDMAIESAKANARKERSDMAKMEVRLFNV